MKIALKKFDMSVVRDGSVVLVVGKRATGKTVLVTDLLYQKRNTPLVVVVSGTESANAYFSQFVPDLFIYDTYSPDILTNLIAMQKRKISRGKPESALILLDDCAFEKSLKSDKMIRWVLMNGRHVHITIIITTQYAMSLGPELRGQADFVFAFKDNVRANRQRLYEHFFGVFDNYAQFSKVFDACTQDFRCLTMNNISAGTRPTDSVFWYKADIRKNFRVGSPELWATHRRHYRRPGDEDAKNAPDKSGNFVVRL